MRVLVTIPHYVGPAASDFAGENFGYGSTGTDRGGRVAALAECVAAWHRCFRPQAMMIGADRRYIVRTLGDAGARVDVAVVTVAGCHVNRYLGNRMVPIPAS